MTRLGPFIVSLSLVLAPAALAAPATTTRTAEATDAKKKTVKKKTTAKKKTAKKKRAPAKRRPQRRLLPKWALGVAGGVNITNAAGEMTDKRDSNLGGNIGFVALYDLASFAQFETGIGYSTRGSSLDTPDNPDAVTTTISMGYVVIPAMLRLTFKAGKVKPFLHGGLYAGFLASSELKTEEQSGIAHGTPDPKGTQSADFGFQLGAGAGYDLNHAVSLFAGLDYARGFSDYFDEVEAGGGGTQEIEQVHTAVLITGGALFRF